MAVIHLLLNPEARGGRRAEVGAAVAAAIRARGHDVVTLRPNGTADIVPTLAQAHADGMSRLVVAGGDGLIHLSLPALAETDVVLGIVPVGTGNDFARALGLPTKLNLAVSAALAEPTKVDLIATGEGRWAASIVTGGFSGQVNARANRLRFPPGQQRYTLATLLELAGLHTIGLTLDIDGTVEELQTTFFAIANTRFFGGGMAICPTPAPATGCSTSPWSDQPPAVSWRGCSPLCFPAVTSIIRRLPPGGATRSRSPPLLNCGLTANRSLAPASQLHLACSVWPVVWSEPDRELL